MPDGIYHFAARGSDQRELFTTDDDRSSFLKALDETARRYELGIIAYCLMANHYHLVAEIPDARVSTALRTLHTGHSHRYNRTHGRRAHLFRNRPLAQHIDSDTYLLVACRYLAHNPVRANLCTDPRDWPWSSYRQTAGHTPNGPTLHETPLADAFDNAANWRHRYRDYVERDLHDRALEQTLAPRPKPDTTP